MLGLALQNYPVSYCYSKVMRESCSLDYGYIITVLVICSNVVKLLCFVLSYWLLSRTERKAETSGEIILTPGDAIGQSLPMHNIATLTHLHEYDSTS